MAFKAALKGNLADTETILNNKFFGPVDTVSKDIIGQGQTG